MVQTLPLWLYDDVHFVEYGSVFENVLRSGHDVHKLID